MRFETGVLDSRIKEIINRNNHVSRIGNLTMVHYGTNSSLQNRGFETKKSQFFIHSHLQLNRALTKISYWDQEAI